MDGWVVVGTKLDTKQLEKDLKNAERRLQQYEREAERLTKAKAKAEIDLAPYEEQKRLIEETTNDALKYAQTEQEVTNQLNIEKAHLEELNQKYSKQLENLDNVNKKIKENTKNQELMKNQIENTRKKTKGLDVDFDKIGKTTSKNIKKIGKWVLAIFSVRSAYMLVRRAVSTLSQYNEDLANKLESMQLILASALEPLITRLVNLAYRLLYYLNYITKAWFNIDLFSSANEKALKNSAKSAEKMKKSLAGFDEMNIMQDTSTTTGATGVTIPSMEDTEIPSWIKWIADNKDLVIAGLLGIAGGLTAVNLGLSGLKGLGIGVALAGIFLTITSILKYLKNPTWENFGKVITGIGLAVAGVAIAFGAWPVALAAAAVALIGIIVSNWEKIKGFFLNIATWLEDRLGLFGEFLGSIIRGFVSNFEELFGSIKQIFDGIIKIAKGDFAGGLKEIFKGLINTIISGLNTLINGLNAVIYPIRALITGIGKVLGKSWKLDNIKIPSIPRLAVGGIVNMPGRGVPVGGAITGEAGREGVIPLTDSQAMETLGATIGKYININLTNITKLDNRQIAKEQKKINAQNDFAFNR